MCHVEAEWLSGEAKRPEAFFMYTGFLYSLASGLARSRKAGWGKTAARPHGTQRYTARARHLVHRPVQPGRIQAAPAFLHS